MGRLPFTYPETAPVWLAQWPSAAEIDALFPPGIRQYSFRIMSQGGVRKVDWSEDSLVFTVGGQRAVWRWANGQWRRSCSCGYKNDCCVHAFTGARIFREICRQESWLPEDAGSTTSSRSGAVRPSPPGRSPRDLRLEQLDLWGAVVEVDQKHRQRLEAEADFHHEKGIVALRFYLFANERRQLLRMQQLYNLGLQSRHSVHAEKMWSDDDRHFISWLSGQLRGSRWLRQNLEVYKLTPEQFTGWQEVWAENPGRFIERASQKPLSPGKSAAGLHVELENDGEAVRIVLVLTAPNGTRYEFHEIFQLLASGQRQVVIDGSLLEFEPPFSWDLIREVFSRKTPRMRHEHIAEHLPVLLEGRLDLVRGDLIERTWIKGMCCIAAVPDGGDILIRVTIEDAVVHPDTGMAPGRIRPRDDGKFVITMYDSDDLPAIRDFFRTVAGGAAADGNWRIAGNTADVEKLVQAWQALPASIRKMPGRLQGLLGATWQPTPLLSLHEQEKFVDLQVSWMGDGAGMTHREMRDAIATGSSVVRSSSGNWLSLNPESLEKAWKELDPGLDADGRQRLCRPEARRLVIDTEERYAARVSERSTGLAAQLRDEPPPVMPELISGFKDILRPYQVEGFDFLADRTAYGVGAILADDMGLGKTVQTLALLTAYLQDDRHGKRFQTGALVVCPASVVSVWAGECRKFCPELICKVYAGAPGERRKLLAEQDWDLLVVNYALVRQDADSFLERDFGLIILDEAQQIKNPEAQITQVVKQLRSAQSLALTGTPLENRVLDLWSIMDFLNPGFLGDRMSFTNKYEAPAMRGELARRIAPLILRRTKDAVAPELPSRTEELITVELTPEQRKIYDREVVRARAIVREKGPIEILAALTRLRQICCHPALLKRPEYREVNAAKVDTLLEMLTELISEGHSALVFSQFTSLLALVQEALGAAGIRHRILTGRTPTAERQRLVAEFSADDEPEVFLLSLKAAGTGLTLTKADYVFLFDPWWNPAVERQAIDRTHRIGQDKPVIAYRLVAADTVEERVLAMQAEKAELFAGIIDGAEGAAAGRLSAADLAMLIG